MTQLRWRQTVAVTLALAAVLTFAYVQPDGYAEPAETFWAVLGSCGSVYAFQAFWRRWELNAWRKRESLNGLFALVCQQHMVLRFCGLLMQLLILAGGISAMMTPAGIRPEVRANDLFTTATLIGLGIVSTVSVWYAERQANLQAVYIHQHPASEMMNSAVAQANQLAVDATVVAHHTAVIAEQAVDTARVLREAEEQAKSDG